MGYTHVYQSIINSQNSGSSKYERRLTRNFEAIDTVHIQS